MKPYCTQNNGDCSTCSLVNYDMDCQNKPTWGGKREGAGRKPSGKKARAFYITDSEEKLLRACLEQLRVEKLKEEVK